jgi:hypothetical protein
MDTIKIDIPALQDEYESYVARATNKNQEIDLNKLINLLQSDGGWTSQGAETLVAVSQQYGSFMLRSALALALAANIEDGALGL